MSPYGFASDSNIERTIRKGSARLVDRPSRLGGTTTAILDDGEVIAAYLDRQEALSELNRVRENQGLSSMNDNEVEESYTAWLISQGRLVLVTLATDRGGVCSP